MPRKIFLFISILLFSFIAFAYEDIPSALYEGKSYELNMDYIVNKKYIRNHLHTIQINKLTEKEKKLINDALQVNWLPPIQPNNVYHVQLIVNVDDYSYYLLDLLLEINNVYRDKTYDYTWWCMGKEYFGAR